MMASITGRLTLMFAVTAGLVSTLAGIALFLFQTYELRRNQAQELRARFEILETIVAHSGSAKWPGMATKLGLRKTTIWKRPSGLEKVRYCCAPKRGANAIKTPTIGAAKTTNNHRGNARAFISV